MGRLSGENVVQLQVSILKMRENSEDTQNYQEVEPQQVLFGLAY